MINTLKTFPIFQNGQLLTSTSLNDVRDYLDNNLRSNRSNLNGIGIVCGFDVFFDDNEADPNITVSKGLAITSSGRFANIDEDQTYRFVQENYLDSAGYEFWDDQTGNQTVGIGDRAPQINIFELSETDTGCPLTDPELDLSDRVVVLYLEEENELQEFCLTNDGDINSLTRNFALKVLLIKKSDIDLNINVYRSQNIVSQADLRTIIRPKRLSTALNGLPSNGEGSPLLVGPNSVSSKEQLQEAYSSLVGELSETLEQALLEFYNGTEDTPGYQSFLALNIDDFTPGQIFEEFLEEKLDTEKLIIGNSEDASVNSNIIAAQYAYAFMLELVETYNELSDEAYNAFRDCLTNEIEEEVEFPRHIMLGSLVPVKADNLLPNANTTLTAENLTYPLKDRFRHVLTQKFIVEGKDKSIAKAQLLFERLIRQLNSFQIPDLDSPILFTPSSTSALLSERAIPYYYNFSSGNTRLYEVWNPELQLKQIEETAVYAYRTQSALDNTLLQVTINGDFQPQITEPFNFDIRNIDFFRIEGHVGKPFETVHDALKQLKRQNFVNFDIALVKFGEVALDGEGNFPENVELDPLVENFDFSLFHHVTDQYPGMEHLGGVPNGGTFIVVYEEETGTVVADFCLPSQNVLV